MNFLQRYEVESEENRQAIVIEIGRRYLGIEEEIKENDEKIEKTELNVLNNQNNVPLPKNNLNNEKLEGQSLTESDLVIDILNDELITLVRQKIQRKKPRRLGLSVKFHKSCIIYRLSEGALRSMLSRSQKLLGR